jgi:hypothetical protein
MIYHESPYGQTLLFSSQLYFSLSDEKLAEIEQNCANIDREIVTISSGFIPDDLEEDTNLDL